ncbi:Smr/MutS family protein [Mycoplasma marinum]|uniref:Smr domain-containing protein n=1 Tax=Mycoplasma marinum TaxID=1937190 RepID=A0A4R0XMT8_9MOLU|nr:Smr/MutS family protein [Mycoplasma marinum]TCG12044.1 hypothetical protein C4B24_00365 [Mycoplasma marinum]
MRKLDLHGLTESEAIGKIQMALYSFEQNYDDEIEIITGFGSGRLKAVLEDELYRSGFRWHHRNGNKGSYIITK